MYYQNYEDYMRQILGYPIDDSNIYETYNYRNNENYEDTYSFRNQIAMPSQPIVNMSEEEITDCYPEIYRLIYPMVCKVCDSNTEPVTKDLINKMTEEIYNSFASTSSVINVRVETPKPTESHNVVRKNNLTPVNAKNLDRNIVSSRKNSDIHSTSENRESTSKVENRQSNSTLRDLIRILILYRLFGNRPGRPRPPRPPFPGGPGRPPIGPGGPNRPSIIQPRDYNNYLEL